MSAAVALTGFVALVARCSCQLLGFLVKALVQHFLHAFSYILEFPVHQRKSRCFRYLIYSNQLQSGL